MHALINMYKYHCIAIRMRCQLLNNSYFSFSSTASVIHTRLAQITCYIHVIYGINIFRHQSNSKRETKSYYSRYSQHIRNNQLFRPYTIASLSILSSKNKLRRKRRKIKKKRIKIVGAVGGHKKRKRIVEAVGRYLTRSAKALVVSEPIAIFYAGHGKS